MIAREIFKAQIILLSLKTSSLLVLQFNSSSGGVPSLPLISSSSIIIVRPMRFARRRGTNTSSRGLYKQRPRVSIYLEKSVSVRHAPQQQQRNTLADRHQINAMCECVSINSTCTVLGSSFRSPCHFGYLWCTAACHGNDDRVFNLANMIIIPR